MYLHPHSAPQKILMGHHRIEHHSPRINTSSPIMSKVAIVENRKQPTRVVITQSFDASITTIGVETVVVPIMDAIRKRIINWIYNKIG